MSLYEQVAEKASRPQTKDEVLTYFKETYGGKWKSRVADRLAPIAGTKRDSVMRRFQHGRTGDAKTKAETDRQYKELGDTIPLQPPKGGYAINGVIYVKYSEQCEKRTITITVRGEDAHTLTSENTDHYQAVSNIYNELGMEEEGYEPCNEENWNVSVTKG